MLLKQHPWAAGEAAAPADHPGTRGKGEAWDCSWETGNWKATAWERADGERETGERADAHRAWKEEGTGSHPARKGGTATAARAAALRTGTPLCHEKAVWHWRQVKATWGAGGGGSAARLWLQPALQRAVCLLEAALAAYPEVTVCKTSVALSCLSSVPASELFYTRFRFARFEGREQMSKVTNWIKTNIFLSGGMIRTGLKRSGWRWTIGTILTSAARIASTTSTTGIVAGTKTTH